MRGNVVIVIAGDTRWHIGTVDDLSVHIEDVELSEDATAKQIAAAVAPQLSRGDNVGTSQQSEDQASTPAQPGSKVNPRVGAGVVLGVPSGWCLCGTVAVPELGPRQKRNAMLFALEEKLPVTAEEVVADFIVTGDTALGVAAETRRLRELVDALEGQGIAVEAICPTALLGLQHLNTNTEMPSKTIAWRDPDGLNLFSLAPDKKVKHWRWLPNVSKADDHSDPSSEFTETEQQWLTAYIDSDEPPQLVTDVNLLEAACLLSVELITSNTAPLVNLRRDSLDISDRFRRVRSHLVAAMTAAAVMLLAITGTCLWRAHTYQQAVLAYESEVTTLYHDTFGDQPRPTSVKRRFDTRLRELRGLQGEAVDDASDLKTVSALWPLYDMLDALPTDKRLCLLDITVEHDHLTVVGQARSHSDADLIAAALRRGGKFEVQPPSTSNLKDGGVSFTLNCQVIEKSPAKPPAQPMITEVLEATAQGKTVADRGANP